MRSSRVPPSRSTIDRSSSSRPARPPRPRATRSPSSWGPATTRRSRPSSRRPPSTRSRKGSRSAKPKRPRPRSRVSCDLDPWEGRPHGRPSRCHRQRIPSRRPIAWRLSATSRYAASTGPSRPGSRPTSDSGTRTGTTPAIRRAASPPWCQRPWLSRTWSARISSRRPGSPGDRGRNCWSGVNARHSRQSRIRRARIVSRQTGQLPS